jgi:hypothetical protein
MNWQEISHKSSQLRFCPHAAAVATISQWAPNRFHFPTPAKCSKITTKTTQKL